MLIIKLGACRLKHTPGFLKLFLCRRLYVCVCMYVVRTATNCYNHTGGINDPCFYSGGRTGSNITENNLLAPDAGTVTCTVTVGTVSFTSNPLTLRISGEQL